MDQTQWLNVLPFLIVALPASLPFLIGAYRSRKEHGFMQRTAQTLGFVYQEKGHASSTQAKGLSGGEISDVISGTHNGIGAAAFTYRVLVGGRDKYWSYMTVFETPLRQKLPDIVLRPAQLGMDQAANDAVARTSFFGEYEEISLEGNFGKYFKLYSAKDAHIEALEVFTPDIMANLIDRYQGYGLEFSNDTLYLYPMKLIKDDAIFMQSLALLEGLVQSLAQNLKAMNAVGSLSTQPSGVSPSS